MSSKQKFAFSLVELMVALIVISCIVAAMAPVMTKKLKTNVVTVNSGAVSEITSECTNNPNFSSDCKLCTKLYCVYCSLGECAANQYKDSRRCECKLCSAKFTQNCIKCSSQSCTTCNGAYYVDSTGNCSSCASKYGAQCSECNIDKCLRCQSGYHIKNGVCAKFDCSDENFMRIGNLCVTRRNMGDSDILAIQSIVNPVNVGETCNALSQKCCWKGGTASICDSANGGYSGCNRTVCNWSAANDICNNFNYAWKKWRLMRSNEMTYLGYSYSKNLGANGLMLCDFYSGNSSACCAYGPDRCPGATGNSCSPNDVWSGTLSDTLYAYRYRLISGTWDIAPSEDIAPSNILAHAFSVRCVTEMN